MADMKRYGCYDKVIGNRRFYMRVYGVKLITITQFLDERDEHGLIRDEESVIDFRSEEGAINSMVAIAQAGGWTHQSEWKTEVTTAW
jgi:hypothetical protein